MSETSPLTRTRPSLKLHRILGGKTRVILAWLFGLGLVLSAEAPPSAPGALLCLAGALLRVWASGHLRKNQEVATSGPYAWVRNPLYLGTYLMALGCAAAAEAWVLLAVASVVFGAVYHSLILEEEGWLNHVLGGPYAEYRSRVPRFWPWAGKAWRPSGTSAQSFDWKLAQQHRALEAIWTWAAMMAGIWLIATLRDYAA